MSTAVYFTKRSAVYRMQDGHYMVTQMNGHGLDVLAAPDYPTAVQMADAWQAWCDQAEARIRELGVRS